MNEKSIGRKWNVKLIIFTIAFFALLIFTDDIQQKRLIDVKDGYQYMERGMYQEAIEKFEEYVSVESKLYWSLTEKVNGYEYSLQGVEAAIRTCKAIAVE